MKTKNFTEQYFFSLDLCSIKMLPVHYREHESSSISCMSAFLRWHGIKVVLEDMIDIAPISISGATSNMIEFIARRSGISTKRIVNLSDADKNLPLLIQKNSGYSFLLLKKYNNSYLAVLPGAIQSVDMICESDDLFRSIKSCHRLSLSKNTGCILNRNRRFAKLFLIPWREDYTGKYVPERVQRLNSVFSKLERAQANEIVIDKLSVVEIRKAHRQLCPSLPNYFGNFRKINLRRSSLFVDHRSIPTAIEALLDVLHGITATVNFPAKLIYFTTRCIVDFLTIHPFSNGNRRVAMALACTFVKKNGAVLNWSEISRPQFYYAIRCAANGHFKNLENLIRQSIQF